MKGVLKTLPSVMKIYPYYNYNLEIFELYLKSLKNPDKENVFL